MIRTDNSKVIETLQDQLRLKEQENERLKKFEKGYEISESNRKAVIETNEYLKLEIESLKKEVKELKEEKDWIVWCNDKCWWQKEDGTWTCSAVTTRFYRAIKTTSELFEMFKEETKKDKV